MYLASDNTGPVHPKVMEALAAANTGHAMPYGADPLTAQAQDKVRTLFEARDAAVHFVALGTAANCIALSTMCQPFQTIFCSELAHIHEDECNAPEFYTGGAKLTLVRTGDKMTPEALRAAIEGEETRGVHGPQRGPVSITTVTERGSVYSLDELAALTAVAKDYGLPVHLDGARFANACAALGCTPAQMSHEIGIDAVSFGGTKNGLMAVEAMVFFDADTSWELELRRKRGAHLFSKHRYLSAQMDAYLTDGLWLEMATRANDSMARLLKGLRAAGPIEVLFNADANMAWARLPRAAHRRLQDAGAQYYLMDPLHGGSDDDMLLCRLVADWSLTDADIDRFVALAAG